MTPFRLWVACASLLFISAASISLVWLGKHAATNGPRLSDTQKSWVLAMAQLPGSIKSALYQLHSEASGQIVPELLISKKDTVQPHWVEQFPAAEDSGYLLWSGMSAEHKQSVIRLIRVSDGVYLRTWAPDLNALAKRITNRPEAPLGSSSALRLNHPLPLANGNIVFNTGSSLVSLPACSSEPDWVLDQVMHHSVEQEANGRLVVPSISHQGYLGNKHLQRNSRDDAISWVSPAGKLLEVRAFSDILIENGLETLLLGLSGFTLASDPVHLNEIKPALRDGPHWRRGDLLISARHLSTVFLYRPATNRILWHCTGPWLNQHSADFVGNHHISVFSNHVYGGATPANAFLRTTDHNRVFVYDFRTHEVSEPWATLLNAAKPKTLTEGRAQVLPDGGLFIEETNHSRMLRFTQKRLLWSLVNSIDDKNLGRISWSRYLTANDTKPLLQAITNCKH